MKKRLDEILVEQGLIASRSRARDAILRGLVLVDGLVATKAGALTEPSARLTVSPEAGTQYVSRGALKLASALDHFGYDPAGLTILDAGASTGGFTEVLLERGAARLIAVDVGHGQLHPRIAADPRVMAFESQDIRTFNPAVAVTPIDAVVVDVSFISLTKVLPALLGFAAPRAWLIALIKPQFEVGRDAVSKGGLVRDTAARAKAIDAVTDLVASTPGWTVQGIMSSPIEGGSGNVEYLMGAVRHG